MKLPLWPAPAGRDPRHANGEPQQTEGVVAQSNRCAFDPSLCA